MLWLVAQKGLRLSPWPILHPPGSQSPSLEAFVASPDLLDLPEIYGTLLPKFQSQIFLEEFLIRDSTLKDSSTPMESTTALQTHPKPISWNKTTEPLTFLSSTSHQGRLRPLIPSSDCYLKWPSKLWSPQDTSYNNTLDRTSQFLLGL